MGLRRFELMAWKGKGPSASQSRHELVAEPSDAQQIAWMSRVWLDAPPKPVHVHAHGVLVGDAEGLVSPHRAVDLGGREDRVAVFGEKAQELELASGQLDVIAIHKQPTLLGSHFESAEIVVRARTLALRVRPTHERPHTRHDFERVERLDDVVVAADAEAHELVRIGIARREEDDRDVRARATDGQREIEAARVGQADDVLVGQAENPNIVYVLPKEGGILWGDNWTIPSNSPNKAAAEKFINFLLRPEISAQIINETYYWLPNDAALPLVRPEIRDNPAVFPSSESVKNSEIIMALSPKGEDLYQQIWERFLAADE